MLQTHNKLWNSFYGGVSSDDKIVSAHQVLFSKNIDLKTNANSFSISPNTEQKISTGTKLIVGFVDVTDSVSKNTKTFGYGEDGVIYDIENGTDNTPNYTIGFTSVITNAIQFNGYIYLMHDDIASTGYICTQIPADEMYNNDYSNATQIDLTDGTTALVDNRLHTYPMYNYLDNILYIASGKYVYILSKNGIDVKVVQLGTGDIIDITQRGALIKLHQREGLITSVQTGADGVSVNDNGSLNGITSVIELGFPISGAVNHLGTDFIIGNEGELGYMDGYVYNPISQQTYSNLSGENKFRFHGLWNGHLSLGSQLHIVDTENNGTDNFSLVSFGNKKTGFPKCFEYSHKTAPDGTDFEKVGALGLTNEGYYYSYNHTSMSVNGIAFNKILNNNTVLNSGTVILPIFDAGDSTIQKKIEEIKISTNETNSSNNVKIYASIDGGTYDLMETITEEGIQIFNPNMSFSYISFKIVLTYTNKKVLFNAINLNYSIIN